VEDRRIVGFHQDSIGDWVADLECGHGQHVRHNPPWQNRPWVMTSEGRASFIGQKLKCVACATVGPPSRWTFSQGKDMEESDLRYPVGRYSPEGELTPARRKELIDEIEGLPAKLRAAVSDLSSTQLDTPYRPGGWTVRQVIHHLPDSHMNAYIRFKLALTEDTPTIKPYEEAAWAELADNRTTPAEVSLTLLEALHRRWVDLLRSMGDADFGRTFMHPEQNRTLRLEQVLGLYAWHGRHHLGHITGLAERMGWN
jgi:uncharacterized damage-inducible protein DinB